MKILFHGDTLNYRGTTVAVADYARYNQEILGNESVIAYCETYGNAKDMGNETAVIEALEKEFQVVGYTEGDLENKIDKLNLDLAYFIRAGHNAALPTNIKTAVHAVFQFKEPHGDKYAYVSKWLSDKMSQGQIPYVPHIVKLPPPKRTREQFGISKDNIIVGRYGGYYTFDIPWAQQVVKEVVESDNRFTFVFVGTEPFIRHPKVLFFSEIHDIQEKSDYINICDVMLHARQRGESFGLSIAEFLHFNKPVLAWDQGHDMNHVELLRGIGGLYSDADDLRGKILNFDKDNFNFTNNPVQRFDPESVMNKFKEVFLND